MNTHPRETVILSEVRHQPDAVEGSPQLPTLHRIFTLFATCLALCAAAPAQQPWQHLQSPTAAEVQKAWQSPPPEYGPEPYYGLNGPATLATVQHDLDTMHALGYQAVTVQAGYGMQQPYLSPAYFDFFKQFVAEVKKRDMRVWIVDDAGYPSGFAGGKFTSEHPELRMQALVVTAKIPVAGGARLQRNVGLNAVAVTALSSDGKSISIPIADSAIDWTAPAGDWTVVIVTHIFSTSPTRSDTNPTRAKDASQSLEDYLDPSATAQYLEFTHEQYKKSVGDEFGKTILGFRGDEPDYSIAGLPWTPKFFDRFQQIKGYDIRPWLASFTPPEHRPGQRDGPPATLTESQRRARADYYDVFSQMFRDGFFKPQGVWCAENHLEYQVHLNHEEMEMALTRSEGSFFRDMQYVEVPGIDSIWHQIWTDTISDFPRLASSAAHVYGHPWAFTESFAAYRPEPDVTMTRYILNEQFVRGVNLIETMYYPATSTPSHSTPGVNGDTSGGPAKYMRDPAYPALVAYVRRMSYLMSMGRPDASVALYLPSSSMWLGDAASDTQFVSTERLLSEHQIDFDIVDEDFFSGLTFPPSDLSFRGAAEEPASRPGFTTASGNSYKTVIIPDAAILAEEALARLKSFAKAGGKVIFLGRTPTLISGRTILDARPATPPDFAFATVVPATLPETPTPPAQPPTSAPTAMAVPPEILTAFKTIPTQDVSLDTPDTAVRLMHRKLADAEVYLFFNESAAPISHTLRFRAKPKRIDSWDPQTGSVKPVELTAPLQLSPYETRVLVVR
jgi:hypothetical protein